MCRVNGGVRKDEMQKRAYRSMKMRKPNCWSNAVVKYDWQTLKPVKMKQKQRPKYRVFR
jgi:hypothetical protein